MAQQVFDPEAMDAAALEANKELRQMNQNETVMIARWFKKHYLKAGHKRLGRVLVQFAKETDGIRPEDFV